MGVLMDQRHRDYVEYYRVRMRKFEGNPLFKHSFASEKAMFEAVETAASLEEFGERVKSQKLHIACAVAQLRDKEKAWADLYSELGEEVRAQSHLEVLRNLDAKQYDDVMDLTSMVNDVHAKWLIPISMDEHLRTEFWSDFTVLENLITWRNSQVPDQWAEERRQWVADELAQGKKDWNGHTMVEAHKFDPNYKPDWDLLFKPRHRRMFPIPDGIFDDMVLRHKEYVGEK